MINIQKDVKLALYSTFKIGGLAKEFVEVQNENEILEVIEYACKNKIKLYILGGGSNILFCSPVFNGIVMLMKNNEFKMNDCEIECGAGFLLSQLVIVANKEELSGVEWAVGIPGTVGGAINGNAGAFGSSMSDIVESVRVYDISKQSVIDLKGEECGFYYRKSIFKGNSNLVIISATIKLKKGKKTEIEHLMRNTLVKRVGKQPKGQFGSAGSFFSNPVVSDKKVVDFFEHETESKIQDGKIPAGWLIDEAGLKGKKIGDVMISDVNANFIINNGNGTAEEILMLSSIIKQKVRNKFGIQLKEEVNLVFDN